eukprot:358084-Chlamydomonas_euryale.AAC.1
MSMITGRRRGSRRAARTSLELVTPSCRRLRCRPRPRPDDMMLDSALASLDDITAQCSSGRLCKMV